MEIPARCQRTDEVTKETISYEDKTDVNLARIALCADLLSAGNEELWRRNKP